MSAPPCHVCTPACLSLPLALRFFLGTWQQEGFLAETRPTRTLREILTRLRETYCGSIGYEVTAAQG